MQSLKLRPSLLQGPLARGNRNSQKRSVWRGSTLAGFGALRADQSFAAAPPSHIIDYAISVRDRAGWRPSIEREKETPSAEGASGVEREEKKCVVSVTRQRHCT